MRRLIAAGAVISRRRRAQQGLGQATPLEQLHREVRPPLVLTDVVDLNDVGELALVIVDARQAAETADAA